MSHAITNTAATISNAEASTLKQNAPGLDLATEAKPVMPPEPTEPQSAENITPVTNDASLANGNSAAQAETKTQVNGHSAPPADDAASSQPTASIANTSLEASTQSQADESVTTLDSTLLSNPLTEAPASLPDQAPISDMRSAPHSDQLPPAAVAQKEAEKHEIDNNVDAPQEAATEPMQVSQTEEVDTASRSDQPMQEAQPTQEAQPMSPPPPPEPSHATLPVQSVTAEVTSSVADPATEVKVEEPAAPAPTPAIGVDQEMTDVPALPLKAVHEREEDNDTEEPASKRVKTDEDHPMTDSTSFKVPESPAPPSTSEQPGQIDAEDEVTVPRLQHMKKVISNLKKSNASAAFRLPVDPIALKIPTYYDFVKKPMDLGTIDNRLKKNEYKSVQAFRDDFHQIIQNCLLFNGPDHAITQSGRKMESSFTNQMASLPPVSSAEPPKNDKKAVKPKVEPVRAPTSRRQSMNTKAASPTAVSPATFAVNPDGMPLIRRDSTVDGRPKRAIIPTKRNSDFSGARPKKKKYELELRFCDETLKNIMSSKHWAVNQYFMHPVDPVALNIPQYFQVIKKPMDLSTVRQKLDGGHYEKAKDFEEDVRLIFKNCFKFNPEGDYVYGRGQELEKLFSQEWLKKRDWMAAREPDSEPASVGDDDGEEEASDEDAEAESEDDERKTQLQQLEAQLELIKSQMGELKQQTTKKKSPSVGAKKSNKKKVKKEAPKTQFPNLVKNKTKKPAAKAKPEKDRYVTFAEKQYISNGIAMLPERQMAEALKIIQNSVPALANSDQGEIELDIEEVPNHALLKLLAFVKRFAGPPPEEAREPEYVAPTVNKTKKSKTMSRQDQDAQIAELRGTLHHYQEGISPEAVQSIETGAEDSDDDDESNEESEEE